MYEAVPSCGGGEPLTCCDDNVDDHDESPRRHRSPAHTCGTHTPPTAATRSRGGDGGAAANLVHLNARNRAHRAPQNVHERAPANQRQLLTKSNAAADEMTNRIVSTNAAEDINDDRTPRTPVMETDQRKDLNARKEGNGMDAQAINGCAHPEWTQRNGILQRRSIEDACTERVDVDHIKLEHHYRHKTHTVGVQTTHLSPYRLRFWPVAASIKCLDASFMDVVKCCLRTLSQWFLSQVGLTCVLLIWALLGATAFYKAEGPREREQAEQISHYKIDISVDLATELRHLQESADKWPEAIQKYLNKHESLLLKAASSGYVEGGGSIWTYPGCVLFAVLLLTTLGFGAPVPRTPLGRGMAVLFSAVGIPLHFMLIINASSLIAKCLRNLATIKPVGEMHESITQRRHWYKWFPPVVAILYYILGVICFGVLRQRSVVECLMFALDFTESGGVATTAGHVRILYALYIEIAVVLAATIMSIVQVSATNGIIDLGLRLGLLTNT